MKGLSSFWRRSSTPREPAGKLINLLVIEDNEDDFFLLMRECKKAKLNVHAIRVDTEKDLYEALAQISWDLIISDSNIPGEQINIHSSLKLARSLYPNVPFIIISGSMEEQLAIQYMEQGVNDYILKDNLIRAVPVIRKIMEQRISQIETEHKLDESNERFRMIAESIHDMFFAVDRNLSCTYWNFAAEKMTTIPATEAIGRNVYDLFPDLKGTSVEAAFLDSIAARKRVTLQVKYPTNQERHFLQVSVYPSREVVSVIVKDITHTRRVEMKLKSAHEELETFMYRVSHDIRGPVASLLGLANLARTLSLQDMEAEIFLQTERMTTRLDEIVRALTAITRIKQDEPERSNIGLHALIRGASYRLRKKNRDFILHLRLDPATVLYSDTRLMEIISEEILKNAVDYAFPGRTCEIVVSIDYQGKPGYMGILFQDNAVGIPDTIITRIFSMFFRGNEKSTGSGLGLYLVKSAVEKLKGSVHVESKVGEGSVFTVYIPVHKRKVNPSSGG